MVIPIGGNYDTTDKLCPELVLSWESVYTLLGFQINSKLKKLADNHRKCNEKMHGIARKLGKVSTLNKR